jgi:hypothetical protein
MQIINFEAIPLGEIRGTAVGVQPLPSKTFRELHDL